MDLSNTRESKAELDAAFEKYQKELRTEYEDATGRKWNNLPNPTTNQWIPLTGPGGRLPTAADSDEAGYLHVANSTARCVRQFNQIGCGWTHFFPTPKAPPLPKPKEKTQQEKDWAKYNDLNERDESSANDDVHDFADWARADGRAQLAREALGLFDLNADTWYLPEIAYEMERIHKPKTAKAVQDLYALLTKAAEEKP